MERPMKLSEEVDRDLQLAHGRNLDVNGGSKTKKGGGGCDCCRLTELSTELVGKVLASCSNFEATPAGKKACSFLLCQAYKSILVDFTFSGGECVPEGAEGGSLIGIFQIFLDDLDDCDINLEGFMQM